MYTEQYIINDEVKRGKIEISIATKYPQYHIITESDPNSHEVFHKIFVKNTRITEIPMSDRARKKKNIHKLKFKQFETFQKRVNFNNRISIALRLRTRTRIQSYQYNQ